MEPFDPLSTVIPSKNSFEFFNPPKKAPQVEISVLNRDEMAGVDILPHAPINIVEINKHFGKRWKVIMKIQHL